MTHSPPNDPEAAVELPVETKLRVDRLTLDRRTIIPRQRVSVRGRGGRECPEETCGILGEPWTKNAWRTALGGVSLAEGTPNGGCRTNRSEAVTWSYDCGMILLSLGDAGFVEAVSYLVTRQ